MIDHAKTQLLSLYLEDPGRHSSHPWYCIHEWTKKQYLSIRLKEDLPYHIYIYGGYRIFYYWNRDEIFRIETTMLKDIDQIMLNEIYLNECLEEEFDVEESFYRLSIYSMDYQTNERTDHYEFKTINLNNDRSRHINLLSTIFTIKEQELEDYFNTPAIKDGLSVMMVDPIKNRPVALGLGSYDPIVSEGVIEYIEILPQYQNKGVEEIIVQELTDRLAKRSYFITTSVKEKSLLKAYLDMSYTIGGKWFLLKRKEG